MNTQSMQQPLITPITIRIIAVQLLFFGLLFLPEISIYPIKMAMAELSQIMNTFQQIVDNPSFYALLMLVTLMLLFSFEVSVEEVVTKDGRISMGELLLKPLGRILSIYAVLFIVSWLFLVYKAKFMGSVYINHFIFG